MIERWTFGGFVARGVALGFILGVAGCQSGGGGMLGFAKREPVDVEAAQARMDAAELRAYCPAVRLRSNAAILDRYAKGGEGDKTKLVYQSSIAETTRSCTYGDGTMTINVAVAGRVVPGPVGGGQTVAVPIKIEVIQGEGDVLHSQVYQQQVQTQAGAGASQYVFSDPNITIPMPAARNIRVFAGFDVPAPKKSEIDDG